MIIITVYDLALIAAALAAFAVGWWLGRAREAARTRRATPPPVCTCKHALSFHDPKTDRCAAKVQRATAWDSSSRQPTAYGWVTCDCLRYVGPFPTDDLYTGELIKKP